MVRFSMVCPVVVGSDGAFFYGGFLLCVLMGGVFDVFFLLARF